MTSFVPEKRHLREALLLITYLEKVAANTHQILLQAYSDRELSREVSTF